MQDLTQYDYDRLQARYEELDQRYSSLVADYHALVKMIEQKAESVEALVSWGDPGWTLQNVFNGFDEKIERLQPDCDGQEHDDDLVVVSTMGLSERLLELYQKADEVLSEIGGIRDDLLSGDL